MFKSEQSVDLPDTSLSKICSMTLWSLDNYFYYASCIFAISLISVIISLYETRRQVDRGRVRDIQRWIVGERKS